MSLPQAAQTQPWHPDLCPVPRWGRKGMEGIKVLLSVLQEPPLPRAEGLKLGSHAQGEEIIEFSRKTCCDLAIS